MMTNKLCIDLCSGLGGFSRAFKDAGWEVVTVDIDQKFQPTICGDITRLTVADIEAVLEQPDWGDYDADCILASPPCERFSLACRTWPKPGIQKAMDVVGACLELIAEIKPTFWILENPKARLRWFLGTPKGTVRLSDYGAPYLKPTDYWGNIDLPLLRRTGKPEMYLRPMSKKLNRPYQIYYRGADKERRAEMPYGLSQAILEAVER